MTVFLNRLVQNKTGIVLVEIKSPEPDEDVEAKILYELMRRWNLRLEKHAADSEPR